MSPRNSTPVLGKFAGSKLAIITATVASVGVISGALALPHGASEESAAAIAVEPAATVVPPPPPQVIRRVIVVRRHVDAPSSVEVENVTIDAPAPKQSGQPAQPHQPAAAPAVPVVTTQNPTATPVAKSRGS